MAKEKKQELSWREDPEFLYQITKKYMKDYVQNRGTIDDIIWYGELVLQSEMEVKRGEKVFKALDIQKVRGQFVERFFNDKFNGEKKSTKPTYRDEIEEMLKNARAQKAAENK